MPLSKEHRRVVERAGRFAAVQGLAHFIYSTLCLIFYYIDLRFDKTQITFFTAVYMRFLDDTDINYLSSDAIVRPDTFATVNWFYIVFDLCWFVLSVSLICDFASSDKNIYLTMIAFIYTTLLISILDLILLVWLLIDYNKPCDFMYPRSEAQCQKAAIPIYIIAAKGFLFWIGNVLFAFGFRRISGILRVEMDASYLTQTPSPTNISTSGPVRRGPSSGELTPSNVLELQTFRPPPLDISRPSKGSLYFFYCFTCCK